MTYQAIQSQYLAALETMRQAVDKCPPGLWVDPSYQNPFWLVVYHALFYTHLYVYPTEADFVPWEKRRPDIQFMGHTPWPPHEPVDPGEPYTPEEMLEYLDLIGETVREIVPVLDLTADSGFDWLPLGKFELQIYSIRHLQQHVGELAERLNTRAGIEVPWVGLVAED